MTHATLYYFSGTGNTKGLAEAAGDALKSHGLSVDIVNVAGSVEYSPQDLIGLFFPVYAYGAPRVVNRFLRRLPQGEGRKAFVVANAADKAGPAALEVGKVLVAKGYEVVAATWIKMPHNYILLGEATSNEKAEELVKAGCQKAMDLATQVATGAVSVPKLDSFQPLRRLVYFAFMKGLNFMVRLYKATDKCVSCGACVEMCPVGAIDMPAKRPIWNRGCEHCMRCVNFCPVDAIEVGRATVGKKRYKYWQGKV